ncbi:AAA family ATPase [Rosistilla oblonga]|uniref:AAA family ATPase n=1 Tax=Rosistilla oblonga TaxID=2527990 RepID=UPI003A974007
MIKPSDVFVPGKFPIEESNVYADRGTPQADVRTALDRAYVPLIFGGYGVGKSSMVVRVAQDFSSTHKVVYVENVYGKSFSAIFERILEELGYEVTVQRTAGTGTMTGTNAEAEISGNTFYVIAAKLKAGITRQRSASEEEVRELVVRSPTESRLIDICDENSILLVVDELHRASDQFSSDLTAFLKSFANRNCKQFRIALIGTENEASRLVISDPGTDRVLEEISLTTLSDSEAQEIITTGFDRLNQLVGDDVVNALKTYSVGSPFVLQFLCLEVAETCQNRYENTPTIDDVRAALATYSRRKAQRLIREYRATVETVGEKRYRKQILTAMANSDDEYVTMEYLVEQVSTALGETVPSTALSGPLRQLKTEKYGKILRDVENPAGGGRLANYSGFTDPAMKSIIRMVEIAPEEMQA